MAVDQETHRPGCLKKTNKPHKTGRHRSKGAIDKALRGRVSMKAVSHKQKLQQRRVERRNQANQIRKNKRDKVLLQKRQLGGATTAPFLVCILPMHGQIDAQSALAILESADNEAIVNKSLAGVTHVTLPRFKQRFAFIIPPVGHGNELTVLDYLKVSDTTILLTSAITGEDEVFDRWGHKIFNLISAQGIPTPIVALMDMESINPKKKQQLKSNYQKFIGKLFPDEKVIQLDTNSEGLNMLRRVGGQKKNILHNAANRPHLLAEKVDYVRDATDNNGTLKLTGFLRGTSLDVNGLVHIPGLGDFQMHQIDCPPDPYKFEKGRDALGSDETRVVAKADPEKQTSLQSENIPDEMDAEQCFPTEEEIANSNAETKRTRLVKRVPKGMSDYQACWIPEEEEEIVEEDEENVEEDDANDDQDEFMSCASEDNSDEEMEQARSETEEQCEMMSVSQGPPVNDEKYDLAMDLQEEIETLKKIKAARIDQLWPDEIDTPRDIPAKDRFQKYRGLESFRTSPWDPKESLPSDYARIFQFKNFNRTKRRIIQEAREEVNVLPGWYITVHVANVPEDKWTAFKSAQQTQNVVMYGLLPHEHQMSLVNVTLKRTLGSEVPIKSKERLIIQCGYRRFVANPIFSQHTNGSKHKYERYFRPHTVVVASFYAPIQFPPAPVLCFKENPDTSLALVARGCLLSCDPDRMILKRVVLSGHPIKINRKSAVVRYMFFNKEDVNYFKPVRLRTRCGQLGHIKESLGTHGHMKCVFDTQLKSHDTVFMYLYKRIFPKWNYDECLVRCAETNKMHD